MSLKRKIALWLCPELAGPVGEPAIPFPHAQHMGSAIHRGERIIPAADNKALIQSLKASQHAHDEVWKAEVLDLLRLLSATLTSVTEGGNAMKVTIIK